MNIGDIYFDTNLNDYVVLGIDAYSFDSDCKFLIKTYKTYPFDFVFNRIMDAKVVVLYKVEDSFLSKPMKRDNLCSMTISVMTENFYPSMSKPINKREIDIWLLKNKLTGNSSLTLLDMDETKEKIKEYYNEINA